MVDKREDMLFFIFSLLIRILNIWDDWMGRNVFLAKRSKMNRKIQMN